MKSYLLILLSIFSFTCNAQQNMFDNSVVPELDLERYLGKWYEIARYDHKFERDLVGVSAEYSMREDGKIKVLNSGYKNSLVGKYSEAIGKAKIPNPLEPAKLKVSFFLFFYGDYFVMDLDDNYQWVIIGSSSQSYLWILSRQAVIEQDLYDKLIRKIEARGYDSSALIKVEQDPNSIITFPPL